MQKLLLQIGDLRFALANGSEKSSLSHNQFNNYLVTTNKINEQFKSLNLDVAHAFMPFEDLSKYYENLFNEGHSFVISHHNKMKEA